MTEKSRGYNKLFGVDAVPVRFTSDTRQELARVALAGQWPDMVPPLGLLMLQLKLDAVPILQPLWDCMSPVLEKDPEFLLPDVRTQAPNIRVPDSISSRDDEYNLHVGHGLAMRIQQTIARFFRVADMTVLADREDHRQWLSHLQALFSEEVTDPVTKYALVGMFSGIYEMLSIARVVPALYHTRFGRDISAQQLQKVLRHKEFIKMISNLALTHGEYVDAGVKKMIRYHKLSVPTVEGLSSIPVFDEAYFELRGEVDDLWPAFSAVAAETFPKLHVQDPEPFVTGCVAFRVLDKKGVSAIKGTMHWVLRLLEKHYVPLFEK